MPSAFKSISDAEFAAEVLRAERPAIVFFWAPWSDPCRYFVPALEGFAAQHGQEVKLVKFQGEFVWHHHDTEDELFLPIRGNMQVEFRDRTVELRPGEFLIVPHGAEHRTIAHEEVECLLFEPAATRNTGNVEHSTLTAPNGVRI